MTATADEMNEGLFGQIVLHILEVLPYLHKHAIFPRWDIKSALYGVAPHFRIIPGVFDLAYEAGQGTQCPERKLSWLRESHLSVIGGNWDYAHHLWQTYFKVPDRVLARADEVGSLDHCLGIHYRGNDKNQSWHTNAITPDTFLRLTEDFLAGHPDVKSVLVATDEPTFIPHARERLGGVSVLNLGEVEFHKKNLEDPHKADRALLDCVLLSRCRYVLKCSSALSGFAKVLNPALEVYRVSASKMFADIPYFPEAYIPRMTSNDSECRQLLDRQFSGDWLENDKARKKFDTSFASMPRYGVQERLKRRMLQLFR